MSHHTHQDRHTRYPQCSQCVRQSMRHKMRVRVPDPLTGAPICYSVALDHEPEAGDLVAVCDAGRIRVTRHRPGHQPYDGCRIGVVIEIHLPVSGAS